MWVVVRERKQVMSGVLCPVFVVSRNSRQTWCQITRVSSKHASRSSKFVTECVFVIFVLISWYIHFRRNSGNLLEIDHGNRGLI